jgi:hypothetical protein
LEFVEWWWLRGAVLVVWFQHFPVMCLAGPVAISAPAALAAATLDVSAQTGASLDPNQKITVSGNRLHGATVPARCGFGAADISAVVLNGALVPTALKLLAT